ncbi:MULTISPECIES: LPS export ABC transporter permease LptF [Thalassobaculum]|uniref:Lipopolysaccharide export system permease protein n=1 Tax=Thalassobaculum litoreum DSM 18839 TaxID=1123362 RepID=A0A8G2EUX0_9PROT|nr:MULTISPECIES: LPS export ABC transporter permease LptF [Thalassobaculum]SDF05974.1 lipopolysaccharide export system permease protein [Thalassobaculum litoreum DSM 18839]
MRLNLYLVRQIVTAMVFIVVSLTCVIWLSQSLRFVDLIVNRGLPIHTFVYLTVMLMPTWLSIVLPIASFASVLFVYNKMTADREMVVMAAAGLSPLRLAQPALIVAVGTTALCFLMTAYLMPMSYRGFKELQWQIRHNFENLILREGEFRTLGDDLTVYVRTREDEGTLLGIVVHDQRNKAKPVTLVAERGALVSTPKGPRVVMANGSRQERDVETGRVNILYFDRYTIDLGGADEQEQRNYRDANELFIHELLNPSEAVTTGGNVSELIAEGHQRLTSPLLALTLTAIGLAVLLSGEFSRRGQAMRIIVAVLLAGVAEAAGLGTKYLAAKSPPMIAAMWLAVLLPIIISLLVLSRTRLRNRAAASSAPSSAAAG